MKTKTGPVAGSLVPPGVVTVTTAGAKPGGVMAVMLVSLLTWKRGEGRAPKFTAVAPVKPVPLMVVGMPPLAGPVLGSTGHRRA